MPFYTESGILLAVTKQDARLFNFLCHYLNDIAHFSLSLAKERNGGTRQREKDALP